MRIPKCEIEPKEPISARNSGKSRTAACPEISCLPAEVATAFDNRRSALAFTHRWTSADPRLGEAGESPYLSAETALLPYPVGKGSGFIKSVLDDTTHDNEL